MPDSSSEADVVWQGHLPRKVVKGVTKTTRVVHVRVDGTLKVTVKIKRK